MIGYIIDCYGRSHELPTLLSWSVTHGLGSPCDCFEIACGYDVTMEPLIRNGYRFRAVHGGETVFYGVVDEIEASITGEGMMLSVSGRGLAALLLDNEADTAEFYACGIGDILSGYVYPFGITDVRYESLGYLYGFTSSCGESAWAVLSRFCAFAGEVKPRFTRGGQLVISRSDGGRVTIDKSSGAYSVVRREKRYGVVSSVIVKNQVQGTRTVVNNSGFIARGGSCRRIVNVPRYTGYNAMRYTGRYQIDRSTENSSQYIVTVPTLFAAAPNDIVTVNIPELGSSAVMRAGEVTVWADGRGCGTEITLTER